MTHDGVLSLFEELVLPVALLKIRILSNYRLSTESVTKNQIKAALPEIIHSLKSMFLWGCCFDSKISLAP